MTRQAPIETMFPEAACPFVANAPMYGFVTPKLAVEVTKAGGFGFMSGGFDFSVGSAQTAALVQQLDSARELLGIEDGSSAALPIGIGVLSFHRSVDDFPTTMIPILRRYRPSGLWLFAPDPVNPDSHRLIIDSVNALSVEGIDIKVFVQVGTVAAAREAVQQGARVLVAQSIDAGGHQWIQGAGMVSLVPEICDMLEREFSDRQVGLLAAGGIADGRGAAAAMALGADGVVMGTRYLMADESATPGSTQDAILEAADGGPTTIKSTIHDDIQGTPFWPAPYDGRAMVGKSFRDHLEGLPLEANKAKYQEAISAGDNSRRIIWAGTGVGLVKERGTASSITRATQVQASEILKAMSRRRHIGSS